MSAPSQASVVKEREVAAMRLCRRGKICISLTLLLNAKELALSTSVARIWTNDQRESLKIQHRAAALP